MDIVLTAEGSLLSAVFFTYILQFLHFSILSMFFAMGNYKPNYRLQKVKFAETFSMDLYQP